MFHKQGTKLERLTVPQLARTLSFGIGWWGGSSSHIREASKDIHSTLLLQYKYPIWHLNAPEIEFGDSFSPKSLIPQTSFKISEGQITRSQVSPNTPKATGLCIANIDRIDPDGDYDQDGVKNIHDACHAPNAMGPVDNQGCAAGQAHDGQFENDDLDTFKWVLGLTFRSETDLTVVAIHPQYGHSLYPPVFSIDRYTRDNKVRIGDRLVMINGRSVTSFADTRYLTKLASWGDMQKFINWCI